MKYASWFRYIILSISLLLSLSVQAQNEFAATLEVLNAGIEIQRSNTVNFIAVEFEAIVGVGDVIRTDETGEARITFFADGTDVVLEPGTEYQIIEFSGDDDDFQLTVEVVVGQAIHRLNRALGSNSRYDVETPGMTLAAQGTEFAIRVEQNGRSGMLVTEGNVDAGTEDSSADVPAEFGVRSEVGNELSDVVRASTFDELDSALDGCNPAVTTPDDTSLNVRLGPSTDALQVGFITAEEIDLFFGVSTSGNWYRITFDGHFGWILSSSATISGSCAGLRVFDDLYTEDPSLYATIEVDLTEVTVATTPAPEATAEATTDTSGD